MAYTYSADVYCDACGESIREEITKEGKAPKDPDNEYTYDSGDFPKYYGAESEESDGPENCGSGSECLSNPGMDYGAFLENRLTSEGYRYLQEMLNEYTPETIHSAAKEWADYYSFTYHTRDWMTPHEWLKDTLDTIRLNGNAPGYHTAASQILEYALALAEEVSADRLEEMFRDEMESDGYFKKPGWYSDEMGD